MSEEFNDNKTVHAQSSETISGGGSGVAPDIDYVRPAERSEQASASFAELGWGANLQHKNCKIMSHPSWSTGRSTR